MLYRDSKTSEELTLLKKAVIVLGGLAAGFIISQIFIIQFVVNDSSMMPAMKKGDRVLVLKAGRPVKGDIVLIDSPVEPGRVSMKRIIAQENDSIEIINKKIFINTMEFSSPWETKSLDSRVFPADFSYRDNMPLIKLNASEYFLLGDNLDFSFDSRSYGIVKEKLIIGKLLFKF